MTTSAVRITIAALLADGAVVAAVGNKVYPVAAPQKAALPRLVVALISEHDEEMLTGAGGYITSRVTVASIAGDAMDAVETGEVVITCLANVVKQNIGGAAGVDIARAGVDHTDHSDDRTIYRRTIDFAVRWRA